jgi:hypothetical protein
MKAVITALAVIAVIVGAAIIAFNVPRYSDAYVALEATETVYAGRGADAERVRMANAMVENEPPKGLQLGPRIHPVGTLAHVRYEKLGRDGQVESTTEVRALVPPIPYFGADAPAGPYGRIDCPQACRDALASGGGRLIDRGGAPGLAAEWILRMPVGKPFELPSESPSLQDVEDRRPISLPQARYRVTVLEACKAEVRMGSVRSIEYAQNATLPIPTGLRTSHWVQLDGCSALMAKKPERPEPPPPPAAISTVVPDHAYRPPPLEIVVPQHGSPQGRAALVVDETAKLRIGGDYHIRILAACRFDAAARKWNGLPLPEGPMEVAGPGLMNVTRVVYRFPEQSGLYWARWTEARVGAPKEEMRTVALVVASGASRHCHASLLPKPPQGEIALCLTGNGPAQPATVPDPELACG